MTVGTSPALAPALPPDQAETLRAALARPASRVVPLTLGDRLCWLKRVETHRSLRWRLQKGDPARALAAGGGGLAAMGRPGLPAPRVLAEGPADLRSEVAGRPVGTLLQDPTVADATRHAALSDAARALARLHRAGLCHGRPFLRDICWTAGGGATLIDFENFREGAPPAAIGRDLALFLQSVLETRRGRDAFLDTAMRAYRAEGPDSAWDAARAQLRRLRWLMPLARLALALRPELHEVRAVLTLRAILGP